MSELEKYQQIFERDPTDLQAFNNVCRAAEKAKDFEYLTELLKYRTQITGDQAEIVDLLFRAGVVYLEKMNDLSRGVEVLLQAFDIDQAHAGIGARLESAYVDAGDFEAALAILEGRLTAIGDADVSGTKVSIRSDLHCQAGELLQDRLSDNDRALTHFRKAIELDKTNAGALSRARGIYLGLSKFKNAAKLCELEARLEKQVDRKVQLYQELADILGNKMNDMTQAVTALKRALKADQHNDDIKLELAQTIANSPFDSAHAKDHKWAADFLTKRARHVEGEAGLELACMAVRAYPTSEKALKVAGARARETLDFATLINECKTAYAALNNIEEQAPLVRRIVKSYLRMGSMSDALAWAQKLEPVATEKDLELIAKLKEASSSEAMGPFDSDIPASPISDAPSSIPSPPQTSIPAAPTPVSEPPELGAVSVPLDPPDDMELSEWLSQLHQEAEAARRVGDDDQAEQYMRTIVQHHPGDQKATTFLERRFRGNEDWYSLRDLLQKCVHTDEFPPAVKTVRLRQAAKLSEENLNDVNSAIDIWYQIKAHDPKVRDARDALERLLTETQRWEELATLYKEEVENTSSRSKKVAAWQQLAEVYQTHLNDAMSAAVAYNHIIELAPDDTGAIESLDELYLREQMYDQLVPLLDKRAEKTHDKTEKKTLILRAASVLQERLGLYEEAYHKAESILAFLPGDLNAIELMESADEEAENWERLIETLNLKARVTRQKADKVAAYKKVAVISATRLEDQAVALKAWNKVLEVDASDTEALDTTIALYESASEWNELVRILKLRIDNTDDKAEKVELHRKLAAVLENELSQPEAAIAHWQSLLELEEDSDALYALTRWYESREEWAPLAEVLSRLAPMVDDFEAKSEVLFKRANLFYNQLGQKEKAIRELQAISSDVNPTHVPTLGLLRDVFAEDGNYEEAANVLEQQIGYTQEKDELRSFYILLGKWSREKLSDLPRAMAAYEKAAGMDISDDEVLDTLDEIFVEAGEWDKLLKMMYGRYQRCDDEDTRYGYLIRGGQLCEEKLEDKKQAWGWYKQIFDNMREHDGALEAVEEAAHRMALWTELVDVFGQMTKEGTDDEKVRWWLKIAEIFEEKLDEATQALEAVLRAFGLDPDNDEMLDSVDRLAVKSSAWDRLATVYSVLAKREETSEGKIEKLMRHARVLYEDAEEPGIAFDVALKAFELDPTSEEMLDFVEDVGRAALRFEDLVKVFKVCAERSEEQERKVELLLKSAAMFKDNLDDTDHALGRAMDALTLSPFDDDVVTQVWEFVRGLEADLLDTQKGMHWNRVVEVYRKMVEAVRRDVNKQVELTLVISKIFADELHEKELAFDALKDAQQLAPQDENTIDRLEEMAGELNMWGDLVEHYRDILDETFEMSTAVMYHRRRARILSDQLERSEEAAEHYWQIIQLDAQDERAYQALLSYYENAGKWNDLVNLLERQLDAATEDEKRQELLLQIADIWENNIGNKYEAKDWYNQVITMWPDNEAAKDGLERLASTDKVGSFDDDAEIQELVSIAPPPPSAEADEAAEGDEEDDAAEAETAEMNAGEALSEEGDEDISSAEESSESDDNEIEDDDDVADESEVGDSAFSETEAMEDDADSDDHDSDDEEELASDDEPQALDDASNSEAADVESGEALSGAAADEDVADAEEGVGDEVVNEVVDETSDDAPDETLDDETDETSDEETDEATDDLPDEDADDENVLDFAEESVEAADATDAEEPPVETVEAAPEDSSNLFFADNEAEEDDSTDESAATSEPESVETQPVDDGGIPRPPAPPKPPMPPRVSAPPAGGVSVAPPPPPPAVPSVPGVPSPPSPPSIPSPPGVGAPKPPGPPSIPSPPSGSFAPPPPPPKVKK